MVERNYSMGYFILEISYRCIRGNVNIISINYVPHFLAYLEVGMFFPFGFTSWSFTDLGETKCQYTSLVLTSSNFLIITCILIMQSCAICIFWLLIFSFCKIHFHVLGITATRLDTAGTCIAFCIYFLIVY
jgi:hypothetical protein